MRRLIPLLLLALIAAACSSADDDTSATDPPATTAAPEGFASTLPDDSGTTTTEPVTETTSAEESTTTSAASSTTEVPAAEVVVALDDQDGAPEGLAEALTTLYAWLADPAAHPEPDLPAGLVEHLSDIEPAGDLFVRGEWAAADLPSGEGVAVADLGSDIVLLVNDESGWRVVGTKLTRFDSAAWYGDPVRRIMVIGTDARPGQDQERFRADSIHVLTSVISEGSGAIVGFPRDSHVSTPSGGTDKYTHINVFFGPEAMVDIAEDLSGLSIEGYLITGFLGFQQLVDAFDGIPVTVPFGMAEPKSGAYLVAGFQTLWGQNALAFSRNRTIANGDFRRSLHQGLVILGALDKTQDLGLMQVPGLLEMLLTFTWTDLSAEQLLTVAATAFEIDPATVPNVVLPGAIRTVGGASVVVLDDGAYDLLADLDDGLVTIDLPPGTLSSQ